MAEGRLSSGATLEVRRCLSRPRRQPTAWSLQAGTVRGGRQGELYGLDDLDDNQFLAAVAPTGDGCADPSLRRGASAAPGPAPDSPVIHAHMVATALDMHRDSAALAQVEGFVGF